MISFPTTRVEIVIFFWQIEVNLIYIYMIKRVSEVGMSRLINQVHTRRSLSWNYPQYNAIVIYKAFYLDVTQGHLIGAPNKKRTHLWRLASLAG